MYTKLGNINQSKQDLSNYIEGFDIYNSVLIDELRNPNLTRLDYLITKNECRPDLIAKDIYGDDKYTALLIITCSIGIEQYKKGTVLHYISKSDLDSIIGTL